MKIFHLVFGIALVFVFLQAAAASEEHYSGPGWDLVLYADPILDPDTGEPYGSMAEFYQDQDSGYWESLSTQEQAQLAREPAVSCGMSLAISRTEEQMDRALELAGRTMTQAEYYACVHPDLLAVVPEWQKAIWENTVGVVDPYGTFVPPGSHTIWEFEVSEDGEIIAGAMTEEELFLADVACPFNAGRSLPDLYAFGKESAFVTGTDRFSWDMLGIPDPVGQGSPSSRFQRPPPISMETRFGGSGNILAPSFPTMRKDSI